MTEPRKGVPTKKAIAKHHGRAVECWACDDTRHIERAHIVPRGDGIGGSDTDPGNYVLLCGICHATAPNVNDPTAMWRWIDAYRAGVLRDSLDEWVDAVLRVMPYLGDMPSDEDMGWVAGFFRRHPRLLDNLVILAVTETTRHAGERRNDATAAWVVKRVVDLGLHFKADVEAMARGDVQMPSDRPD